MSDSDRKVDRPSRRIWSTAAYIGLLAAGVVAAWQIHVFWQSRHGARDQAWGKTVAERSPDGAELRDEPRGPVGPFRLGPPGDTQPARTLRLPGPGGPSSFPAPASRPARSLRPSDLAEDPMQGSGLKFLRQDTSGLKAPAGAQFRYGIQRVEAGMVQQHLTYNYRGEPDTAAELYKRTMKDRGLDLVRDAQLDGKPEERILVFESAREQITVRIGKRSPNADTRFMTVTLLRLAE